MPSWGRCRGATGLPRAIRAITARKYVQLRQIDVIRLRDTHRSCRDTLPPTTRARASPPRRAETGKCACHVLALNLAALRELPLFSFFVPQVRTRNEKRFGHAFARTHARLERERERERERFFFTFLGTESASFPIQQLKRAALFTLRFSSRF